MATNSSTHPSWLEIPAGKRVGRFETEFAIKARRKAAKEYKQWQKLAKVSTPRFLIVILLYLMMVPDNRLFIIASMAAPQSDEMVVRTSTKLVTLYARV